jgi:hypothetical protein
MRIYIACGLTHIPRDLFNEYSDFIHALAADLRTQARHEIKYALVNSDPQLAKKPFDERARLCYLWDRGMVEEADLIIAEASFPSIGLGIELQLAQQQSTPIILCFRDFGRNKVSSIQYVNPDQSRHELQIGEGYVSLMALGIPEIVKVIRYESRDDGIAKIIAAMQLLERT